MTALGPLARPAAAARLRLALRAAGRRRGADRRGAGVLRLQGAGRRPGRERRARVLGLRAGDRERARRGEGLDLAKELLRQNEGRFKVGALPRTVGARIRGRGGAPRGRPGDARARSQRIARDNLRALVNARSTTTGRADHDRAGRQADGRRRPTSTSSRACSVALHEAARADRRAAQRRRPPGRAQDRREPPAAALRSASAPIGLNGLGGSDSGAGPITDADTGAAADRQFGTANQQVLGGYSRSLELLTDGRYYQYLVGASLEIPLDNADAKARLRRRPR